jgi:TonB family protein
VKKAQKDKNFVKNAYYKGGDKALEKFIAENLKYPEIALKNDVQGTIHIKYDINQAGRVTKVQLLNSLGFGCDEEAERVVRMLRFEVPPTRGLRLTFHKEIHIHFRKNTPIISQENTPISPQENTADVIIEMQYTEKAEKTVEKTTPAVTTYNYIVEW